MAVATVTELERGRRRLDAALAVAVIALLAWLVLHVAIVIEAGPLVLVFPTWAVVLLAGYYAVRFARDRAAVRAVVAGGSPVHVRPRAVQGPASVHPLADGVLYWTGAVVDERWSRFVAAFLAGEQEVLALTDG